MIKASAKYLFFAIVLAITGVLVASVLGLVPLAPVFVESHVITDGKFGNLVIGESKIEALSSISEIDPTTTINPVPAQDFFISKKNLADISDVKTAHGVRLFDYHGTSVDIYFSNYRVYKVNRSYNNRFPQFQVGDTTSVTIVKLLSVLKTNNGFFLNPAVDYEGTRSYNIQTVLKDTTSKLFKYDAWEFEVSKVRPAGAFYTLFFSNQHLDKIEYRRPRIRNDL